jgi:hypothetical protein
LSGAEIRKVLERQSVFEEKHKCFLLFCFFFVILQPDYCIGKLNEAKDEIPLRIADLTDFCVTINPCEIFIVLKN